MDSTELYRQLLGVTTPWTVELVEMSVPDVRVDVHLSHPSGARFACPQCGVELSAYDHAEERRWRHLDSCQFRTFLHARAPRVKCPQHGVRQTRLPWSEPGSRFTLLFETLAMSLTWDEAWDIMERAVVRGRRAKTAAKPQKTGIDEKAIAKGHRYTTLVCDLEETTVEYIGEERRHLRRQRLDRCSQTWPREIPIINVDECPVWPRSRQIDQLVGGEGSKETGCCRTGFGDRTAAGTGTCHSASAKPDGRSTS